MYNPKFEYKKLTRSEEGGTRKYLTPDGDRLPSVTTILSATQSEEKRQSLREWQQRMGTERARQITTEAANRGTRMHSYLEKYVLHGEKMPMPTNPFAQPSWHMANTVISQGLANVTEFWGMEVPLYFPRIYAGTTDCVGIHNGQEAILDYKQTNKPKRREWIDDYFIQLLFYATAHNELYNTTINKGVIMMCVKPTVDEQQRLLEEPQYQEFVIEGAEWEKYQQLMWDRIEQYYMLQSKT